MNINAAYTCLDALLSHADVTMSDEIRFFEAKGLLEVLPLPEYDGLL